MTRTVYQVYNLSRREAYVGLTAGNVVACVARFRTKPPSTLHHWNFSSDRIETSSIEVFLDEEDAVRYYSGLVEALRGGPFRSVSFEVGLAPA